VHAGKRHLPFAAFIALIATLTGGSLLAEDRWSLEVEGGAIWFGRNDVRIPGDAGTRFDMRDITGKGPAPYGRLALEYDLPGRHSLRATVAPLRATGTGTFDDPVFFAGETFAAGVRTRGVYEFNNYRLTYKYDLFERERWGFSIGATAFVRDARVELRQDDFRARDTDVGLVPLVHLSGWVDLGAGFQLDLQLEGLAASQGRAFDGAAILNYQVTDRWDLGVGYRAIEGGVDNRDVYSFALIHHALARARFSF